MITFTFQSTVLELPNPQIPMTHNVNVKTKFEHDMLGRLHSTRYTPANDKHTLPFTEIVHSKMLEAEAFFITCRGGLVRYIDELGTVQFGKIVDEEVEFTNTNKRAGEQFTYNFQVTFERTI